MSENRIMSVMLKRETSSATASDPVALVSTLESPMPITNCGEREITNFSRAEQGPPGPAGEIPEASACASRAAATSQAPGQALPAPAE